MDFIPISALSEYLYCPRNCYLFYVLGEEKENPYTVEGKLLHQKGEKQIRVKRRKVAQTRRVYVYSNRYQISGFADIVEEKGSKIYPIEYKGGKKRLRIGHKVQVCAQALCLEEMLNIKIPHAFIYYASSERRLKVQLDSEIRSLTKETIQKVKSLLASQKIPPSVFSRKCRGCSLEPLCLPQETAKLKRLSNI